MKDPDVLTQAFGEHAYDGCPKIKDQQAGRMIDEQPGIDPVEAFNISTPGFFHDVIQEKNKRKKCQDDNENGLNRKRIGIERKYRLEKKRVARRKQQKKDRYSPYDPSIDKAFQHCFIEPGQAHKTGRHIKMQQGHIVFVGKPKGQRNQLDQARQKNKPGKHL
jgi:hypothetical protein